ncbi:MAG: CapA family protein [Peptococcia bacterium]|jgi:D-alanyl-D-alanine dipeptidase/poly-gamma-glutamate capsule biosynthesis protein CapA/YwtB (metallophosphatase superfamily)
MRKFLFNTMIVSFFLTILFLFITTPCFASEDDSSLVNLREYIPNVYIEIKYATENNFTKQKIYSTDDAYLRLGTAKKLTQVQEELLNKGYSLKIWDAFRPIEAQFELWKVCPNPSFVANPYKKYSKHSRGMAVDVTLVSSDGTEIEMPTEFDEFGSKADRDYSDVEANQAAHALLLEKTMEKYGFKGYQAEWWHFEDVDGAKYGVIHNPKELLDEKITTLVISAIGDCVIGADTRFSYNGSFFDEFVKQNEQYGYFFSGVKNILENDDLTIANLENVLTDYNQKPDKSHQERAFFFKGPPNFANILKEGSIEAVNLANNHSFDYLEKGLSDTKASLKKTGINYCGYEDKAIITTKGKEIGLLGYNTYGPLEKGSDISVLKQQIKKDLSEIKESTDLIIVSFHWGEEYNDVIPEQKLLGRYAIDSGADLVLGHHPHVIQEIENYNGKYIVYSLGNFVYGGNRNPPDKDTFIFQQLFEFKGNRITNSKIKIIPCLISSVKHRNDYQPTIVRGEDAERIYNRVKVINNNERKTIIKVNGQTPQTPIPYFINKEGRTMIGLRALGENLGATVDWDGSTQVVTLIKGANIIKLIIGQSQYILNGQAFIMDTQATIMEGRTMVPLRVVSEGLGAKVGWDDLTRTISLDS